MRGARLWTAVFLSVLVAACDDDQTGASEGITFFEHPDYEGDSVTLAGGFSDFDDLRGPCNQTVDPVTGFSREGDWDNCISSVLIDPGWEATVYEHDDYEGDRLQITGNILDLDDVRGRAATTGTTAFLRSASSRPNQSAGVTTRFLYRIRP